MDTFNFISPSFIVADLQAAVAFYVEKLGFEVWFIGPDGEDPFWAMIGREKISIFLKGNATETPPLPNNRQYIWGRWDAYISVNDPDALYAEYQERGVTFHQPLENDGDNLRGFEIADADGYILFFGRPWP